MNLESSNNRNYAYYSIEQFTSAESADVCVPIWPCNFRFQKFAQRRLSVEMERCGFVDGAGQKARCDWVQGED